VISLDVLLVGRAALLPAVGIVVVGMRRTAGEARTLALHPGGVGEYLAFTKAAEHGSD